MSLSGSLYSSAWHSPSQGDDVKLKFSWSATQNIAGNYSSIHWEVWGYRTSSYHVGSGNFLVRINGSVVYQTGHDDRIELNSSTMVASGDIRVYHTADGKKSFSVYLAGAIYAYDRNVSGTGEFSLNDIPRQATLTSAPSFNDEQNPTIGYSNPAGDRVTSLRACISIYGGPDIPYRDIPKGGSSYTFRLSEAERTTLIKACQAPSIKVTFYLETWFGNTRYASVLTRNFKVINAAPQVSLSALVTDPLSTSITKTKNTIIKGISSVKATATFSEVKGGGLVSKGLSNGSKQSSVSPFTFVNVTNGTFQAYAEDSRGNRSEKKVTLPLINYFSPSCTLTVDASVNESNKATFHLSIHGSFFNSAIGGTKNFAVLEYRVKPLSGSYGGFVKIDESNIAYSHNDYTANLDLLDLNYQKTYVFQVRITDVVKSVYSKEYTAKTLPLFELSKDLVRFNVPVLIMGGDVVIAKGYTRGWYWRKWLDGHAECWKTISYQFGVNEPHSKWGSIYRLTKGVPTDQYPFDFIELPAVIADVYNAGTTGAYWTAAENTGSKTHSPSYFLIRGNNNTQAGEYLFVIHAFGRYK